MTIPAPDSFLPPGGGLWLATATATDGADRANMFAQLHHYVWVFLIAFAVAFVMTPVMRRLAVGFGIVDQPDARRKLHAEPVAYLGGVSIFLGWLAGLLTAAMVLPSEVVATVGDLGRLIPVNLIIGAAVILVVGVLDDVFNIGPRVKIAGQLFAAAALANQQVPVTNAQDVFLGAKLVNDSLSLVNLPEVPSMVAYALGTGAIALFVLGGCNAVNLVDGLDGLATGLTAICMIGLLLVALVVTTLNLSGGAAAHNPARIVLCVALLGALLAFLPYNFNPAVIFMGDAGSLLLGYLTMGVILHFTYVGSYGPIFVTAGLIVFAIPIIDTTLAIVRRKVRGLPISSPDYNHLHHQILRGIRGMGVGSALSVKLTVLVMYLLAAMFAVLGTVLALGRGLYVLAVALVIFCFIGVTAYKAAHRQLLRERLRAGGHVENAPGDATGGAGAREGEQMMPVETEASGHEATRQNMAGRPVEANLPVTERDTVPPTADAGRDDPGRPATLSQSP